MVLKNFSTTFERKGLGCVVLKLLTDLPLTDFTFQFSYVNTATEAVDK
jgi:hypothetical protein